MDEHNNDLYEQQLFTVFKSCLTKGQNELEESELLSICNKLHLNELTEELKSCICKHNSDKQTISFQEFRDGLLLLLKRFQGLITDKQCIIQPLTNLSTCNSKKNETLSSINNISKIHSHDIKTNITMDENRSIRLWEKLNIYLGEDIDSTTMQFISNCLGIPELPNQITESIFEKLDRNCDGLINFNEFVILFQKRKDIREALQKNNESHNSIESCDINMLDRNVYKTYETNILQNNEFLNKEEASGFSNICTPSSSADFNALDINVAEITNIICDELKNLNDSLDNNTIQSHINLLREMLTLYQDEQRNLSTVIENIKAEKEKMRISMIEANERANLLAQEIDEHQAQLEILKETLQKQSEQRYAEITKELSNQLNIEREIDAAALKTKDDQLQILQKEHHDIKNKFVNILQENQLLETENGSLLNQIDKLRQSNNDLLSQIKILDAEHDEIQNIEAKQQEQVDFFVERIKQLQSEITLLRDQNDELSTELESFKCYSKDIKYGAPSCLAQDLQIDENKDEDHISTKTFEADQQDSAGVLFGVESVMDEGQTDISNPKIINLKRFQDMIIKDLENILITNIKCIPDKCAIRDDISKIISSLQSNLMLHYSSQEFAKSVASEFEIECEERTNESLRDIVISTKAQKLVSGKRAMISNSAENLQNKITSLRDYPPRKEEHSEQCKTNKEKDNSSNITEIENISMFGVTNAELQDIETKYITEKKQLNERCLELERSLDLLKAEYEECEDYWAAKLEEERQLFEQEQKISDDKLSELINKMAEYEELISPLDKTKNSGRLSPIDERFNLEQQYVDLEDELEKWKVKYESDISQKNLEIQDLCEKSKLVKQSVTNDFCVQVPDGISLSILSGSACCKSSSVSSIPLTNESSINIDLYDTNNSDIPEFSLSNDPNKQLKQKNVHNANYNRYDTEYSVKQMKHTHIHKNKKFRTYNRNSHAGNKAMLVMKEKDKYDSEKLIQNALKQNVKEINCHCAQCNAQQHICCIDVSVLQNLNMKLYVQERKKRQMYHYLKRQQRQIEKVLQHVMTQHQIELFNLQCLLRNTQKKLQIQVQTTVEQADRLANADILVKDLYIENAYLTAHMKRMQEQYLVLANVNVETTSM